MRCLYCGKELALLKRWTGGGEFCSDAHRQQYQEEYNQLALNRLLQAKPLEPKPGARPAESKTADSKPAQSTLPEALPKPQIAEVHAAQKVPALAAVAEEAKPDFRSMQPATLPPLPVEPEVIEEEAEEDRAPAEAAGFLLEVPVPVTTGVAAMAASETGFERSQGPTLPTLVLKGWGTELVAAPQVTFQPSIRLMDYSTRLSEGRLEVREFVRGAPVVEFAMKASGETGITEKPEEPMDILIFPHPPQESPALWQEGERQFTFETELGALARVTFPTTGLQDNEENAAAPVEVPVEVPSVQALAEAVAHVAPEPVVEDVVEEVVAPVIETAVEAIVEPAVPEAKKEEVKIDPPVVPVTPPQDRAPQPEIKRTVMRDAPPVFQKPAFLKPPASRPAPIAETAAAKPAEKIPDVVTRPLPLTLHGLAAGRGKPVQVFPSAVASGVDLQVPRSTALPLRPVMTLGPAPAAVKEAPKEEKKPERSVLIKADPKKQRPDPRFGNGKGRKPEPEKIEPEKKAAPAAAMVKEAEPVKVAAPAPKPEPVKAEPAKTPEPETRKEAAKENFPAPLAGAPYEKVDLGLPSLSLDASGSFWSKLPLGGKIGAGLAVVLAIAGIFYMMSKGGGAAASTSPRVVEAAPALPVAEAGWITDWGAEPGVRRQHDISVLRASTTLTDYRLEFEAQIENKALGWVYRAKDPKNYYVTKLEIVKPGLDPTVALVRFAVINGEEQPRAQFPLSLPVHIDTLYKIRFDAVGDRFTTYVQDQQVDEWTDDRIKSGGIGLYAERGESKSLNGGVIVVPLVMKR